jgi:hypothetical protein
VRLLVRNVLLLVAALSCAFELFAFVTTQVHAVRAVSPWQDDPYDAVVSFTMFVVPGVVVLALMRVPLCLARFPLPAARLAGLLRASRAVSVLVAVTLITDWLAPAAPPGLAAALVALSVLDAIALTVVYRLPMPAAPGPDWGDDLIDLLGVPARWVELARRHRLVVAFLPSFAFGVAIAASHVVFEGASRIAFLLVAIGTAGMFGFLLPIGAYLRLLSARRR